MGENDPMLPWSELRQYFTQLTSLVYVLDRKVNAFMFFSFSKIVFIAQQIYLLINTEMITNLEGRCINSELRTMMMIYFAFASIYLLVTMYLVSYTASQVHHLSRVPLDLLYTVPAHTYDRNFQRFMDQVYHSNVSLSGLRIFFVSRKMILNVLASLLTYELVLLQEKYTAIKV